MYSNMNSSSVYRHGRRRPGISPNKALPLIKDNNIASIASIEYMHDVTSLLVWNGDDPYEGDILVKISTWCKECMSDSYWFKWNAGTYYLCFSEEESSTVFKLKFKY